MIRVMLCGASDTEDVKGQFADVTVKFGGQPWHYLAGQISYLNSATAKWDRNSRKTVAAADMCVFVIVRDFGALTWGTELLEALNRGTPFLILCLSSTYKKYRDLTGAVPTAAIQDESLRRLVETMSELEIDRQLTIVQFDMGEFRDIYLTEVAKLFAAGLDALQRRTQREALAALLSSSRRLTTADLVAAEELALDEFEDKNLRKQAILALSDHGGVSTDTTLTLLRSREQGVQRLAIDQLPRLYRQRPPDVDFLADCVALANEADDVGVARRLIPVLFQLDLHGALEVLPTMDLTEIGTRRRLATELERYEGDLADDAARVSAIALLQRCLGTSEERGWIARCQDCIGRLQIKSQVGG